MLTIHKQPVRIMPENGRAHPQWRVCGVFCNLLIMI